MLPVKTLLMVAATLALSLGPVVDSADGRDSIRLRVNDATAEPGGLVAVVIRTYAPRPISQGQISVRAKRKVRNRRQAARMVNRGAPPPLTLESFKVFSQRGDATFDVQVSAKGGSKVVLLRFSSKSGSINRSDGPLAVLFFRLAASARPRQEYELSIDVAQTMVVNPKGRPIRFIPRPGVLRVRKPDVDRELEINGDTVAPGEVARVELQTFEPVAMSGGHLEIEYDPSITSDLPSVTMNKKYGRRRFDVDLSTRGKIKVDFRSNDASWNLVPGGILTIDLPTSRAVANGSRSQLSVDDMTTELLDSSGSPLSYSFKGGAVIFKKSTPDGGTNSQFSANVTSASTANGTLTLAGGQVINTNPSTSWDPTGDLFTLAEVANSLAAGNTVTAEGDDTTQSDGSILATSIKAEDNASDGDGGNDQANFKDDAASVDQGAGTITLSDGQVVAVNASTSWDTSGDLFTLAEVASSLAAGNTVTAEGDGTIQSDGSILATSIKAEDNASDGDGGNDQANFKDDAASVDQGAGTITLSDGQVVAVNASTSWDTSGDLFTLAEVASSLAAGTSVEIEGEGQAQADGSILATDIKAKSKN